MKPLKKLLILLAIASLFASCKKNDPEPELEQEVITDVTLKFTEVGANNSPIGQPLTYKAVDPQGFELGNNPVIASITGLAAGKRYLLEIELFNSIENEDVTEEIEEEDDEHQFYFLGTAFVGNSAFLTYEYADADGDGNPVGLKGYVQVAASPAVTTGSFRLVLRHDLNKSFAGANNPNFVNFVQAGGETDLDVTFPVTLQ